MKSQVAERDAKSKTMAAIGAVVATLGALTWSALLGYVTLVVRRYRNARLFARDEPAIRDCVFPLPVVWMGTALGAAAAVAATLMGATWTATLASALFASSPPFALMIGIALATAFARTRMRP